MAHVSIVVLVHNAPGYALETLTTVRAATRGVDYEVLVVDNASEPPTRAILTEASARGLIDRLVTSRENLLFAKGNNLGASLASERSTHLLLLNSDVRINSPDWLGALIARHQEGATAFGVVETAPVRADGYCLLIDKHLYARYRLDERFPWWWSVTKLQANLLEDGYSVLAIRNHEEYLHHYGGKSNVSPSVLIESQRFDVSEAVRWFGVHRVRIHETV